MVKVKEQIYADEVLGRPGIIFPVEIEDPKERVQAYLDEYKPKMEVRSTVPTNLQFMLCEAKNISQ